MGDFNIDLNKPTQTDSKAALALWKQFTMKQIIMESTRVTNTSETLIDHVIINRPELYHQSGTLDVSPSDHCLNYVIRKKKKPEDNITYIWSRTYRKYDKHSFKRHMSSVNWQAVLTSSKVEEAIENFYAIILKIIEICPP